jgi:hypothetical protein
VSIWVALETSSLYLDGIQYTFNAGDVVVFSGDCKHSGAESDSSSSNFRLFAYVPTRAILVPWEVKTGMSAAAKVAAVSAKECINLHDKTNPKSKNFDPELFSRHLYDGIKNQFYRFSTALWLSGLTTITSEERRYLPYCNGAPDLAGIVTVKCPHFEPHDFNADRLEKAVLNDFRRQCVYCPGRKKKRARIQDASE